MKEHASVVALQYLALGVIWISCSDEVVDKFTPRDWHVWLSMAKGTFFVGLTALFIHVQFSRWSARARRSEERLHLALRASRTGVWEWHPADGRVEWSPECYELTGMPLFSRIEELQPFIEPWPELDALVEEGDQVFSEIRFLRPDGAPLWLECRGIVCRDPQGRAERVLGTMSEVTERHEREAAYRALFEHSPEPRFIQCEGRFQLVNAAMVALLGAEGPEQVVGREVLEFIHPDSREVARDRIRRLNQEREPVLGKVMVRLLRVDGGSVQVESLATSYLHQGKWGAQVLMHDCTARLEAERVRTEIEARSQEARRMEAVGQLAGGVAHDFNNLLTVIQGNASLIEEDPSLAGELAKDIASAAERGGSLTQQLLLFSRRQAMHSRPLDLSEVTRSVVRMLSRLLGENVQLQTDLPDGLPRVEADEGMLEQVIINLALNARDAMPEGGCLQVSTQRKGDEVCLMMRDNGCGIPAHDLPHIFEPFFTTKEIGRGTGLGLASVYGIVQQHRGTVEVESEPGRGSCFTVRLPASSAPVVVPRNGSQAGGGGSETILLVEDDQALSRLACRVLQKAGYRVLTADCGPSAVTVWQEHPGEVDLLLSDLVMPGQMSGLLLAGRLREDRPELKVLLCSGYSEELLQRGPALEAGFLAKPYTPDQLVRTVRSCLEGFVPGRL